jgi:hypothetical protein
MIICKKERERETERESLQKMQLSNIYQSVIVVISDNEGAPAAPYVMELPLDFHNIGITVNCMIFSFLQVGH